jgi:hypothetical protein
MDGMADGRSEFATTNASRFGYGINRENNGQWVGFKFV